MICNTCGVELEEGLKTCPLCFRDPAEEYVDAVGDNPDQIRIKDKWSHLWELSGIIAIACIATCTLLDIIISKGPGWSLFSGISTAGAWVILTLFLHASGKPAVILPGLMITTMAVLFLFDLITPGREWFLSLGLPLSAAAFLSAASIVILYRLIRLTGLNILAASFIILSAFCITAEIFIDKFLNSSINPGWSLIASVSILPVALILFFYHHKLKKGNRLDSFFHI